MSANEIAMLVVTGVNAVVIACSFVILHRATLKLRNDLLAETSKLLRKIVLDGAERDARR